MSVRNIILTIIATLSILSSVTFADTTVTSSAVGITAYLPDNWVSVASGDSTFIMYDSTYTCRSQIVVNRHTIQPGEYAATGDWTRSHFLAYLLIVQYSYDPFGAVLYFDSSASAQQDSLWSPEAFTEFYSLDTTLDSWNEYMRYAESGSNGYELYAIGDTADMKTNIGMYVALMQMIDISRTSATTGIVSRQPQHTVHPVAATSAASQGVFDLLGKRRSAHDGIMSGIYYRRETGSLLLKVR